MIRIGLVDVDTSHAKSFAGRLIKMGDFRIEAVYDAGDVRTDDEVGAFCKEFDCARCDSVEALADRVDAAMVLSADWNVHLDRARPLLEAGRPLFVDKPLAGSVSELQAFVELVERTGTPFLAGSGWRLNAPIRRAHDQFKDARIGEVLVMMHRGVAYYGIHAIAMMLGLLGPGVESVETIASAETGCTVRFTHARGASGHLLLGLPQGCFMYGMDFTVNGAWEGVRFDGDAIHDGVCDNFAAMVRTGQSPLTPLALLEPTHVLLTALQSWEEKRPLRLAELDRNARIDSADFMAEYCAMVRAR